MVGLDRGRQGRIARNKKARTGRASWVFRRLSETGLDSYLVGRGNLNSSCNVLSFRKKLRLSFFVGIPNGILFTPANTLVRNT